MNHKLQTQLKQHGEASADLMSIALALAMSHRDLDDAKDALAEMLEAIKAQWSESYPDGGYLSDEELQTQGVTNEQVFAKLNEHFNSRIDHISTIATSMVAGIKLAQSDAT